MPLPTLEAPTYKAKLLSTGKEIDYRPFLVKEEKILLIAQESGDQKQIIQAVKDLLRACTFEKLDINSITMFDLEYLFLLIRSKSVGENISYGCKCKKCEEKIEVEFSLESIEVKKPTAKKKVDPKVQLTDSIGVTLRHPRVGDVLSTNFADTAAGEQITLMLISAIESVWDSENVYPREDTPDEEMKSFVESLNHKQMEKLTQFLESSPKLQKKLDLKCEKCGHNQKTLLEGLAAFF
jgi:hypothetical protein